MDLVKEKACQRCGTVKPNDFQFFGKKLWKTRHDFTTNKICIKCQKEKVSASMKARWKERKTDSPEFEHERLRMARALEAARTPEPVLPIVDPSKKSLDEDDEDLDGIRPISFEEVMDPRSRD
jgi:hypothetical protein